MEKREKVLLVFMGIAVVGALLFFLVGGKDEPARSRAPAAPGAAGPTTDQSLEETVQGVLATARSPMLSVREEAMLNSANEPWVISPFYESTPGELAAAEGNATFGEHEDQSRFVVTGVLLLGETDRVAIINGWDYRVGDEILPGTPGYFVTDVTSGSVSIGRRDDRSGEVITVFTLQLEEDDPFQIRDNQ